ncbi:hypothetical protein KF707_02270 [Candidatus Obscuribacterales bacterium]|jgi:hypothetical protein|nr:hypothetical protein [Candidatus Obscuribacterales bacterium]MBX3135031.1 hypothetical protein [Candidatus Obscuribacterales bacterium]MBX3151712.1 hypothetical protein [Candidatus Obscuribacterales bacterium]
MTKSREIEKLIENMKDALSSNEEVSNRKSPEELLYTRDSLKSFKTNQAWPGRNYILVGNSYNVEKRVIDTSGATRRTACIAVVLERGRSNRRCVSIEEALKVPGFVECLSRFEYEWLKKQPPSTLLGPAFDNDGNLVQESFAVWRREETYRTHSRKPVLSGRYRRTY